MKRGSRSITSFPRAGGETAASDGRRYRWLLMQAAELSPAEAIHAKLHFARFLESQFGVETMASFGNLLRTSADDAKKNESGPYAVGAEG